jgi:hypothetical protein
MVEKRRYATCVPVICAMLFCLLAQTGCRWAAPSSESGPGAKRDSVRGDSDLARTRTENAELRSLLESARLDLAKYRAAFEQQAELNDFLREELANTQDDLDRVERQFISFEKRLKIKETKASAVAASAEVHLLFDRLRSDTGGGLDSLTVSDVTSKLETCEDLIQKQNYAAAVYFANRAMRIINHTERRQNLGIPGGGMKVISVKRANLRNGPGSRYRIIGQLTLGTVVMHIETAEEWVKVRTDDGTDGWVHGSLLR